MATKQFDEAVSAIRAYGEECNRPVTSADVILVLAARVGSAAHNLLLTHGIGPWIVPSMAEMVRKWQEAERLSTESNRLDIMVDDARFLPIQTAETNTLQLLAAALHRNSFCSTGPVQPSAAVLLQRYGVSAGNLYDECVEKVRSGWTDPIDDVSLVTGNEYDPISCE